MNPGINLTIVLEERTQKKDGTFPVKLRITYSRIQRYYNTGIAVTSSDFTKLMSGVPKGELREKKLYINAYEQKAQDIINALAEFSFDEFSNRFRGVKDKESDFFYLSDLYITNLKKEGRIKTASSYQCSVNSLSRFIGKTKIAISDINTEFLKRYEKSMLSNGGSITTVGIYMRSIRTIINLALSKQLIEPADYPFGRHKYIIPAGRNIKKAFPSDIIKKLFQYESKSGREERAKDFWILSYLCNGVNMKDIARLKNKSIKEGMLYFIRAKTEHSSRLNQKTVSVYITPPIKEIIDKWSQKGNNADAYIFPILEAGISPEVEMRKVEQFIKTTNKYLKRIGEELNLSMPLTTYTARHSYATMLKRSGVPLTYISDSLGHNNLKTTENYFDGFEDDVKMKYASLLTEFDRK